MKMRFLFSRSLGYLLLLSVGLILVACSGNVAPAATATPAAATNTPLPTVDAVTQSGATPAPAQVASAAKTPASTEPANCDSCG